jgi:hypothetical protein
MRNAFGAAKIKLALIPRHLALRWPRFFLFARQRYRRARWI